MPGIEKSDEATRPRSRWRSLAAAAVALTGALGLVVVAETDGNATPASGVSATVIASGTSAGRLKLDRTRGATDVVVREITIEPGGTTGWHYHPGQLIAVVKQGTLTRELDDCSTVTSQAGDVVLEEAGKRHVHVGSNLGTVPVVLDVTYVIPHGSPLAVSVDAPACGSATAGS
jgi:quercetin dioxygenase-like cupin family protein